MNDLLDPLPADLATPHHDRLPTGAIVGIALGAVLLVVNVGLLMYALLSW